MATGTVRDEARGGAENATVPRISSRPSSPMRFAGADILVSLRQLKEMVQGLEPSNLLRIMVLGEPDEMPRSEYAMKVLSWYRLILTPVDSVRLDGR